MKKVLCLSMTTILLLSLYCCGGQKSESNTNISDLQSQIESAQNELSDIESNSDNYRESLVSLIDDYESQISNIESNNSVIAHESVVSSNGTTNSHTKTESTVSHKHSYTTNKIEATCTKSGTITYTCLCGDTYTETIPVKGHNYKITVTSATCTAKGYTDYKCTNCGNSYVDNYTNALGHSTDDGTCSRCGISIHPINVTGTRKNPVPLNTAATYDGMSEVFDTYKINITLKEIIRGDAAWDIIYNANPYNSPPPSGKEYILIKLNIKALDSKNDDNIDVNHACFDVVSKSGVKYDDFVAVAGLNPTITEMYAGAEQEGYFAYLVAINDTPLIVFLDYVNNGLWFSIK